MESLFRGTDKATDSGFAPSQISVQGASLQSSGVTGAGNEPSDHRPRTAVMMTLAGMGDLVWHVPYMKEIAALSYQGRICVISPPTTFARELIGHEPWVDRIIDFDRRPRRAEARRGRHAGFMGLLRMAREIRSLQLKRIAIFAHHGNRAFVALCAGIPERIGFGTTWVQRLILTNNQWIEPYTGSAVPVYKDATSLMKAQRWSGPLIPRLRVRPDAVNEMEARLQSLPRPLHALAIGASEPFKQWGDENFARLAALLVDRGHGVVILGGPAERLIAGNIAARLSPSQRSQIQIITDGSVSQTVAALSIADTCIGNDTGAANIAAAVETPTFVLLGPRPDLDHDPTNITLLRSARLADLAPSDVASRVLAHTATLTC